MELSETKQVLCVFDIVKHFRYHCCTPIGLKVERNSLYGEKKLSVQLVFLNI